MSVSTGAALLWILLLTFTVSTVSGAQKLTLTAEPGATINIRNNNKVKGCQVCTGSIINKCSIESLNSFSGSTVSVELECSRPQDVFSIEIVRRITCTTESCSGHIIQADFSSIDALRFNRTFTWNLAAAAPKAFQIDFTNTGLKQINPSEKCPDRHTYTLQAFQSTGNVAVGKYCRSGTISSAQVLKSGSFSVDVPAEQKLQNDKFDVTVREKIKWAQKLTLTAEPGATINIRNNNKVKGCQVCTRSIIKKCSIQSLNSFSGSTVSVALECSRPQDVFSIEIVRRITCTTESCSGHIIQADFSSIDALRFNRTFTWNLAAAAPKAFQIDFTNTGLKLIHPSEKCPDRHTYTLQAFQSTGSAAVEQYCRSGTISSAQILKSGSFSVDVPAEQKLQNDKFDVTVREKIKWAQKLTLTAEPGATINIRNNNKVKGCQVCTGSIIKKCSIQSLNSFSGSTVSVELECSTPQDVFSIEIVRRITCTTESCSGHIIQTDFSSTDVLRFNRTFTWNLAAAAPKAFQIDFTNTGLKQINPSEKCPDRHTYTLQAFQSTGNVAVGKYCRSGTISSAQVLKSGSFSVDVPAEQKLQNDKFEVTVREKIKSLARISLTLPKGTSSSELLSPDYPESFPDDDTMEWYFQVPDKHGVDVQFLNLTQPDCVKKEVAVEYHQKGRVTSVLGLNDTQPLQNQGDFLLTLRNCEMERAPADSPGLTFTLKVSAYPPRSKAPLTIILGVVATLLVISVIVLVVMIRKKKKEKKKKKKGNYEVAVYNPNGINFLPGYESPDVLGTCKDDESHVYEEIDDTLVYTHLLKRGAETGNYEETYKPVSGHRDSQKPLLSSQQGPPRPNKPPSKILTPVDNTIYQNMIYQPKDQSEDEQLPNLGPRLELEGGN
ncbi:uncharacterized protein LOC112430806 isoform X3 [Maylandia zebra]|uniref:uncharacterized protein LOC112430806 isoform X3 n=1 Tax=Maylandia zebra TaxID=106582 RepID=UPI00403C1E12